MRCAPGCESANPGAPGALWVVATQEGGRDTIATEPESKEEEKPKKKPLEERLLAWLSHPLVLLFIGAIVTGILVPSFTRGWQNEQTAQATKTKVITDVGDAVSTAMTQLEIDMNPVLNSGIAPHGRLNTPQNIAASYNAWTMKKTNVASEVTAYFPSNNIPTHWGNLSGLINNFFLLTYAGDPGMRHYYIFTSIKPYFDVHHISTGIDWSALQPDTPWTPSYRANWIRLDHQITGVKNQLVSSIMDAPTASV